MKKNSYRIVGKRLNNKNLIWNVHGCFSKIHDPINGRGFQLVDYLMSGLAIFSLKFLHCLNLTR